MAIADEKDFTHIARTTTQWENARDKYEIIPEGVLCVEFSPSNITKIKIGDGHKYFSQLPYIGNGDLNNYYTKRETDDRVLQIMLDNCSVRIKGELDSETKLPTHAACGDVWFVKSTTESDPKNRYIEYIYSHEHKWEIIGGTPIDIDLSGYAKKEYVDEKINVVNKKINSFDHHTHDNKIILDQITAFFTSEEKLKLKELHNYDDTALRELIEQATHNHPNKVILDKITAAYTVADKSKLDGLSNYDDTLLIAKITALEELAHEHLNKTILDNTTASFTKEYEKKLKWIRVYTGATDNEDGIMGMVPPAPAGDQDYVLNGAGEWVPMQGGSGPIDPATKTKTGVVKIGDGISVKADGTISILPPDEEQIGGITPGVGLTTDQFGKLDIIYGEGLGIDDDGKLYATGEKEEPFRYHPGNAITFDIEDPEEKDHDITINATIATDEECGVVIVGDGLSITEDGIVSVKIGNGLSLDEETGEINVDIATYETPGIVKPGKGLTISEDGTLDVTVQAPDNYHPGKGVYFTTVDETYHGVTYIETDGIDKVIDTDVLPAPDMEMHIQFSFIDPTPNTYISGVDDDTNGGFTVGTNDGITLITNDIITTPDDTISPSEIMETSINLTSGHVLSDTIPLFARSMNGTYDGFAKMRLYSAFIVSNNEVVNVGLVPVVRDSDNKPGLFNLATGDFLTNAIPGGGDFIAGELTDKLYPMTHGDDKYINIYPASNYSIGGVIVRNGLSVDEKGFLDVSIGDTLYIDESGRIEVKEVPDKKKYSEGTGISITQDPEDEDNNIITNTGILDVTESEENNQIIVSTKDGDKVINITPSIDELPIATKDTLGGIIVGDNLTIDENGKLSATGGGGGSSYIFEGSDGIKVETSGDTYQILEYIESTGMQEIETDILMSSTSYQLWTKYCFNDLNRSNQVVFFVGNNRLSGGYGYGLWSSSSDVSTHDRVAIWSSDGSSSRVTHTACTTATVAEQIYISPDSIRSAAYNITNTTVASYGLTTTNVLSLFGMRNNDESISYQSKIKMWYFQIYSNDVLTHNLYPAKRLSDGEIGLFDKLTKKFYTNTASDDKFIGGFPTGEIINTGEESSTVKFTNLGVLNVKESEEKNQFIVTTVDGDKTIEITPSVDELPIASEDTLGGIKVGDGLEIDANGVLSATGGGGSSKDLTVSAGEGINVQTKSFDPTAEYHRISYIRNNQDSYIIIPDYIANSSTRVVVEYSHNPGVYRTDGALFGAKSSSYGYAWYSYWRSGYDYFIGGFQYGSNSTSTVNISGYPQGTKMLLDVSTRGVYLNKELIQSVVEKGSLPAYPMSIFAASSTNTGASTLYKPGAYTIYSFKIYEGEDLVKDLVPALNNEMVPGLWDLINGVFYGSANTNSFAYDSTSVDMDKGTYIVSSSPATLTTIGGIKPGEGLKVEDDGTLNVSETIISEVDIDFKTDEGLLIHDVPDHGDIVLPTGYKSISYIESRANAYMNLDYNPSSNTRLSIDVSFKQGSGNFTNNAGAIIGDGSPSTDSVPKYTLWGHWTNSMTSPIIRLSNGTVNRDSVPGAELLNYYDHKRITFDIIPMDGLYADGEKIQDWEGGEFEPGTRQIQINRSSSYTTYGLRIYSIKIWDKGVLLLNLVPVLDPSNVSGLYDTIRKKFFKTLSSSNYLYDETSVDVITVEKTLTLLPATKTFIGGVRIGDGLSVTDDGTINVTGGGGGGYANIEVGNGLTMSGSSSITYEILDFVQTNGHQSVLTDLYPSLTKTTVEVKYEFLNISNDNVVFSTGRAFGSGELMYGILNTTGWHLCSALGMGSRYDFLETTVPTGIVEDTYTVIDRSSYGSTLTGTKPHSVTLANSSPIQLFKVNNWSTLASVKLYSMNVFNDDTLVGELVPARNKITKQVVIFNKLTNAVYPSNTSVSLIPGEPTGETIVVSTGQTQIIDVKLGNGLGFDANGAIEVTGSPPTPSDTNYVTDVTSKPNVSGVLQVTKEKPETSSEIDLYESFGILTINCVADEE